MKTIGRFAVLGVLALGLVFAAGKVLEVGAAHAQTGGAALVHVPDAGFAYVATLGQKFNGSVQCREPSCIRLIAATGAPSTVTAVCTTDAQVRGVTSSGSLPDIAGVTRGDRMHIESGGLSRIVAVAADGGDPGCVCYTEPKNP